MPLPRRHIPAFAGAALFAAMFAAASLRYDHFFTPATFLNLLGDNSFLGIVAVGMTFVILSGGIDLSVGAVVGLATVVTATLITDYHWRVAPAFAAAIALGTLIGAGSGCLIHFAGLRPFIATLAAMFLARGLAFILHLEAVAIDDDTHTRVASVALHFAGATKLPVTAIIFLTTIVLGTYVAVFTSFGRSAYALGGSEEAALLMGVAIDRAKIGLYALSGGLAALGGVVLTLYAPSGDPSAGVGMELDAIAAVVIGGTLLTGGVGSIPGTLVGVLTTGLIVTIVKNNESLSAGTTRVAIAALLLAFVALQRALTRLTSARRDP